MPGIVRTTHSLVRVVEFMADDIVGRPETQVAQPHERPTHVETLLSWLDYADPGGDLDARLQAMEQAIKQDTAMQIQATLQELAPTLGQMKATSDQIELYLEQLNKAAGVNIDLSRRQADPLLSLVISRARRH